MNTSELLQIGSRVIFFLFLFLSIRTGDVIGFCLSLAVFLIMEHFIETLIEIEKLSLNNFLKDSQCDY